MKRVGFKMKLKPGMGEEYKKRHDNIWPELKAQLKASGVCDYSIFFDEETNILFAVQKENGTHSSQDSNADPIVLKWWNYMADLMETNPDHSPVTIFLPEVFYLE